MRSGSQRREEGDGTISTVNHRLRRRIDSDSYLGCLFLCAPSLQLVHYGLESLDLANPAQERLFRFCVICAFGRSFWSL